MPRCLLLGQYLGSEPWCLLQGKCLDYKPKFLLRGPMLTSGLSLVLDAHFRAQWPGIPRPLKTFQSFKSVTAWRTKISSISHPAIFLEHEGNAIRAQKSNSLMKISMLNLIGLEVSQGGLFCKCFIPHQRRLDQVWQTETRVSYSLFKSLSFQTPLSSDNTCTA